MDVLVLRCETAKRSSLEGCSRSRRQRHGACFEALFDFVEESTSA
jgi:hypothetical protein